jgi:hypothetical protein
VLGLTCYGVKDALKGIRRARELSRQGRSKTTHSGLLGSFLWCRGSATAGFGHAGVSSLFMGPNRRIVSIQSRIHTALPAKSVLLPSQAGSTTASHQP